jgi:hypothetical protein
MLKSPRAPGKANRISAEEPIRNSWVLIAPNEKHVRLDSLAEIPGALMALKDIRVIQHERVWRERSSMHEEGDASRNPKAGKNNPKVVRGVVNYRIAKIRNGSLKRSVTRSNGLRASGSPPGIFENYRIRALLYAGKPNWRVLASIVVR